MKLNGWQTSQTLQRHTTWENLNALDGSHIIAHSGVADRQQLAGMSGEVVSGMLKCTSVVVKACRKA